MATANNPQAWSSTPANNATADSTIASSDTESPDAIDNDIRNVMAAVHNLSQDMGGALVAGGTSTALTVTSNQIISSAHIANGYNIKVRTASAATGAATIAVDGLTAKSILTNDGLAVSSGLWASGAILDLVYSSTAGAFIAANLTMNVSYPVVTKTIANANVLTTGASPYSLFTVSGDVLARVFATIQTTLVSTANNGTISVGVSGNVAVFLAAVTANATDLVTGTAWALGTTSSASKKATPETSSTAATPDVLVAGSATITATIATNSMTAGAITFYCQYLPLSSGASVVAA